MVKTIVGNLHLLPPRIRPWAKIVKYFLFASS